MRRFRVVALLAALVSVLAACTFALAWGLSPRVADVARGFVVAVPTLHSQTLASQGIAPLALLGKLSEPATRTMPSVPRRAAKPVQTGLVVVSFRADSANARAFVSANQGRVIHAAQGRLVVALPTPKGLTPNEYRSTLERRADVAYASPDQIGRVHALSYVAPTDTYFFSTLEDHWWLNAVKAPSAWQTGFGSLSTPLRASASAVKVAVIDTGIYMQHPDLANAQVGKDEFELWPYGAWVPVTDNDITPYPGVDVPWHGTAVAGTIGAAVNHVGTVGVGYDVIPVGYKVAGPYLSASGAVTSAGFDDLAIAGAIFDATDAGCRVINMSFGGPGPESPAILQAEDYAHQRGVLMIAAAGNDGTSAPLTPASDPHVIAVSAVAPSVSWGAPYSMASFSSYGSDIALAAPGQHMLLDLADTSTVPYFWSFGDGTSFAAPTVAGAAAFLWRAAPSLTVDQITALLESSATDLGVPGRDDFYGYGMLDMNAAYNLLIAQYPLLARPAKVTVPAYANSHSVTATWSPVAGTSVLYSLSVDGSPVATTSATSYTLNGLADGAHAIKVQPTSVYNWWNVSSATTADTVVDVTPPVVSGFSILGNAVNWSVTEADPYTVQAYVDTATPAAVIGNALTLPALGLGAHTLHVEATDAAGNSSGWVTWDFAVGVISPIISDTVINDALSTIVSWPAVGGATSYDFIVNGGSVQSTGGPAFALTGLTGGSTSIQVRSVFGTATSSWASATLNDVVVTPATPVLSAPARVTAPGVTAGWSPSANASRYEYRVNGGTPITTSATSVSVSGLRIGATTIEVRAKDNLAQSSWATATVSYAGAASLRMPSTPSTVIHGRRFIASETISAPTRAPSASVTLRFYRYQKSGSRYVRALKVSTRAAGGVSLPSTTYRARLYLAKAGRYRVIATYSGGGIYRPATSVARYFRVK